MFTWNLMKKFATAFLYFTGLVGAMTTAFGIVQAVFSDKLLDNVSISGNPCDPGEEVLMRWEKSVASNVGEFVYLSLDIHEAAETCEIASIGEYPFMTKADSSSLYYIIPFEQPIAANYMARLELPVSEAARALLVDGFLDFYNEGILKGRGVFFVDLLDNPHSGPLYRLVPAPYSVETNQMQKCSASFHAASSFLAQTKAFVGHCVISF